MEYEIEIVEIKQSTQPQIERLKTWNQKLRTTSGLREILNLSFKIQLSVLSAVMNLFTSQTWG